MRWLKLTVAYDGTRYAGWQFQPELPTVQGEIERAWHQITGEQLRITASGRTDAGVHARGQVVGVATATEMTNERLSRGLNAVLPEDIVVREVAPAPDHFHATHDALKKRYRYVIHLGPAPPLFGRNHVWHYPTPLDVTAMSRAGGVLVGRHDFASFESAGSERSSTVRTITDLVVRESLEFGERVLLIEVEGDGFLYNMVRSIVGTLIEVGRGAKPEAWVGEVLAARDRAQAGQTAPAKGLCLWEVWYE